MKTTVDGCEICELATVAKESPATFWLDNYFVGMIYRDQAYEYRSIILLRDHVTDIADVDSKIGHSLYALTIDVGAALKIAASSSLINYALLGNRERHVHWHLIPRRPDDPRWGKPPWPVERKIVDAQEVLASRAKQVRAALTDLKQMQRPEVCRVAK